MSMSDAPDSRWSRLARLLKMLDVTVGWLERAVLTVACILIVVIMLLISADAVSRYLFNSPLGYTFDLVTMYFLPGATFFALAFTMRRAGHVNVDIVLSIMPTRMANGVIGVALLLACPMVAVMAVKMATKAHESWMHNDMVTGIYSWPVWIGEITVPIGMGMLFIRLFHMGLANVAATLTGRDDISISVMPGNDAVVEDAL